MRKRLVYFSFAICLTCLCMVFICAPAANTAYADTGPKPSVHITFENMSDELCYGTLLSKSKSTGPHFARQDNATADEDAYIYDNCGGKEIYDAFVGYEDEDGFYFLQIAWQCNETKGFA